MANKPNGNLTGIKSAMLDRLKSLYDFKQGLDEFASFELLSELCACSGEINREISVYISRDGSIVDVSVGDSAKVSMPSMRLVRNEDRLCGVRCIHTHPSGDGRLSGVDLGTLRSMKLDCMAAVGVSDGKPTQLYAAYLGDFDEDTGSRAALVYGPMRPYKLPQKALIAEIFNSDDRFRSTTKKLKPLSRNAPSLWAWIMTKGTTLLRSSMSLQNRRRTCGRQSSCPSAHNRQCNLCRKRQSQRAQPYGQRA